VINVCSYVVGGLPMAEGSATWDGAIYGTAYGTWNVEVTGQAGSGYGCVIVLFVVE
jgi:hypothetical protein